MQTFLPKPDFELSLRALDYQRLGKQRVESFQILKALITGGGWSNHPATKMWRDNIEALMIYHDLSIAIWVERGYNNTMKYMIGGSLENLIFQSHMVDKPSWFGDDKFHKSHQSNLLRKAFSSLQKSKELFNNNQYARAASLKAVYNHYYRVALAQNWIFNTKLPYIWPI